MVLRLSFKENDMKKIATLVGVSAVVMMLGLGSGYAQQVVPKESAAITSATPTKQATMTDVEKGKALPAKPGLDVKAETGAPVAASAVKPEDQAGEMKATVGDKTEKAASTPKEMEKAAAPKTDLGVKPEKAAPLNSSAGEATGKTVAAKSASNIKPEKATDTKSATEKIPEKAGELKPPAKQ
jgi:hypothetical protein